MIGFRHMFCLPDMLVSFPADISYQFLEFRRLRFERHQTISDVQSHGMNEIPQGEC